MPLLLVSTMMLKVILGARVSDDLGEESELLHGLWFG